jgi:hypothetical protein
MFPWRACLGGAATHRNRRLQCNKHHQRDDELAGTPHSVYQRSQIHSKVARVANDKRDMYHTLPQHQRENRSCLDFVIDPAPNACIPTALSS